MTMRLLALLLFLPISLASYAITLNPGDEECFIVRAPDRKSTVSGNYDLLNDAASGDVFRARLELVDEPHTTLWKSSDGDSEGKFAVDLDAKKRVELCMELVTDVEDDQVEEEGLPVGFNLYLTSVEHSLPEGEIGPDAQRALDLVQQATSIHLDYRSLLDHFDFLRNREAAHSALTASILSRVMTWTVIEAFLVISMAIGQVVYWRKFFEQRRYL